MYVRLAFSVAIHANRDILLMDEVLAVGDTNFQGKCLTEFMKYKEQGKTVVLVTHDIATVQRYCDRAMLLREGKIEMIGDPQEVGNKYIRQNMSDEERRIADEEKRMAEKQIKTEKAQKEDEEKRKKETEENLRKRKEENAKMEEQKKKEERRKKEKENGRWGSESVVLSKIDILDSKKETKRVFNPLDDVIIRMYYKKNDKNIAKAVFGIQIFNDRNYPLFGFNTSMIKRPIELEKDTGYVDFELKEIPLLNGTYKITPAIADETAKIQYDYWNYAIDFTIMNKNFNDFIYGEVNIKINVHEDGTKLAG
jgi:hypothetical protein